MLFFHLMVIVALAVAGYLLWTSFISLQLASEEREGGIQTEEVSFLRQDTVLKIEELEAKRKELSAIKNDIVVSEKLRELDLELVEQRAKLI